MKTLLLYTGFGILTSLLSESQSFSNLDFENAKIVSSPSGGLDTSGALPNWEVSLNGQPPFDGQIWYNFTALDQWQVSIYDTHGSPDTILYYPPISGEYSVFIRGGRNGFDVRGFASIAQSGTIDASSHSMLFAARSNVGMVEVSFAGAVLPLYNLETSPTYSTYGADVTAFAGQTGELKFTANFLNAVLLDDIRFSPEVVPEPSALAFLFTGSLLLVGRARGRQDSRKPRNH